MLALACQRGHLAVVKLLVLTHGADPESYAVRKNEFPVIVRLPLYAAIKSGGSPVSTPMKAITLSRCGPILHTQLLLSNGLCGGFRNSILCVFKRSASFLLPPTHSCKGISVTGANRGKWDHIRRHFKGQSPTKVLSLTGTFRCQGR